MNLSSLVKTTETAKKRLGQGHGSGRVKTSGRGTKGQKSRGKVPFTRYSGGSLSFVKQLPFRRGKAKNKSVQLKAVPVEVNKLNILPKGTIVDIKTLVEHKIITAKTVKFRPVKILGKGKLSVSLTVKLPVSQTAKEVIEKAGGLVET